MTISLNLWVFNLIQRLYPTKIFRFAYCIFSILKTWIFLLKPRESFSQVGEDILLEQYFPEKFGHYLDIGAGRPVIGSNTYKLYRSGWVGVTVDPIRLNSILHKLFRSRDRFWLALCGSENEVAVELFEFFPYEYTTTNSEIAEHLVKTGTAKLVDLTSVVCFPVTNLATSMHPALPTLVCIDAEGSDFKILRSIDFKKILPRVICIESLNSDSEPLEIEEFLRSFGYLLSATAGHSLIFTHESYKIPCGEAISPSA